MPGAVERGRIGAGVDGPNENLVVAGNVADGAVAGHGHGADCRLGAVGRREEQRAVGADVDVVDTRPAGNRIGRAVAVRANVARTVGNDVNRQVGIIDHLGHGRIVGEDVHRHAASQVHRA